VSFKKNRTFYNEKNIIKILKMFKAVISTLNKYNIEFYIDFGTLIGAMRDKKLIPWDHDIDISLLNKEDYVKIPNVLEEIKKKYGYRIYLNTFEDAIKQYNVSEQKVDFAKLNDYKIAKIRTNKFWKFGKGYLCIDIFFKYEKNEKLYWCAFGNSYSTSSKPLKEGLVEIDFYNLKVKIPKNYDEYLTNLYGNWRVPKKDWTQNEHCALNR